MPVPRTYVFAGGGTGGHLFPGIAVAQELQRRRPDARMLFVGSDRDLEQSILAQHQFAHRPLPVESLSALRRHPFRFAVRNWRAWRMARVLLREEHPAAVIGLGGYASAPLVWAGARSGLPIILLEQNVIPGRTTRWLARSADAVCSSYPEASARLPKRTPVIVTGNPLRAEILDVWDARSNASNRLRQLLILGGSQGADSLNDAVIATARSLQNELAGWQIIHQTGPRQVAAIRQEYDNLGLTADVQPFLDDMAARYRSAAIVISRAGATTLAELTCCGLPMVLLPYQHAADDHQRANARSLEQLGAAIVVEHGSTATETADRLTASIRPLLCDDSRRISLGVAARAAAHPDATMAVADQIESRIVDPR